MMSVGIKIRKLREKSGLTQPELAYRLDISQATLCNIESGVTKKIDFILMDKVCKEFNVEFEYFTEDKQINKIKKNQGTVAYQIDTVNNFPENLIDQLKMLIQDNHQKEQKIKELENKLRNNKN